MNRAIANPDGTGSFTLGDTTYQVVTDSLDEAMAQLINLARSHAVATGSDVELVAHAGDTNDRTGLRITPGGEVIVDNRVLAASLIRSPRPEAAPDASKPVKRAKPVKEKAVKPPKPAKPPTVQTPKPPREPRAPRRPVSRKAIVWWIGATAATAGLATAGFASTSWRGTSDPVPTASAPAPTLPVAATPILAPGPRTVKVTAQPAPGLLQLQLKADRAPVTATVVVRTNDGKHIKTIKVRLTGGELGRGEARLPLRAGIYRWTVRVPDAAPTAGTAKVPAPPAPAYIPPPASSSGSTYMPAPAKTTTTTKKTTDGDAGPVGINDGTGDTGPVGAN
ncbi:hypothetical protein GCM10011584_34030 [Nocardioides phosphati]|uniref:Uncharacterized protein n=1 Tax=Nocardioides phosphati TaxID=1867775 RepID=A0ABQ2NDM9_9ACTN|nr:hypothetical protein [Nocardioides phosphati]GGO94010.1 hypothetical protein GCM10011584_34030 [Nocardioides phosphati]